MSDNSTTARSRTDWEALRALDDADIDLTEAPEITEEQLEGAALRVGGKALPEGKTFVGMLLDRDILEQLKTMAGEKYQALINETLRACLRGDDSGRMMRRILREELHGTARS